MLDWGGWDAVGSSGEQLNGEQLMFDHFQDHLTDLGSLVDRGWHWWFDGTLPTDNPADGWSSVDVAGGGNYWSTEDFNSHFQQLWEWNGDVIPFADQCLHDGYAVVLSVYTPDLQHGTPPHYDGGHAITMWGFDYHYDNGNKVYDAIWITDSDDDQGDANPLLYKVSITWDATHTFWDLGDNYSGWHIDGAQALNSAPTTYWSYDFQFDFSDGDYYTGKVYADARYGYYDDQEIDFFDENGTGHYTILGGSPGDYAAKDKTVEVTSYFDHETGRTYTGDLGSGTSYFGSESGHIINPSVDDFFFGLGSDGVFYEADLAVKYGFVHHYANNDWYSGIVYAPQGYYGDTLVTTTEIGAGYYDLTVLEYLENVSQYGQVYVEQYYDTEMKRIYLPSFFWGSNYLGSEYGYINIGSYPEKYHPADDFPPGINKFFFGHWGGMMYEADVKEDKKI